MEKRHRIKIIFAIIFVCITFSCNNNSKNLEKFKQRYPILKLDSLPILETTKFENFIDYNLTSLDSNKILAFTYIRKDFNKMKQGDVYFEAYLEKRMEGEFVYVTGYDENKNILYSFKQTENRYNPAKDAIFLKGKYYYYYKFYYGQLNKYQKRYYKEHEDSIVCNHINEIPQFEKVFSLTITK